MPQMEFLCDIGRRKIYARGLAFARFPYRGMVAERRKRLGVIRRADEEIEVPVYGFRFFYDVRQFELFRQFLRYDRGRLAQKLGKAETRERDIALCRIRRRFEQAQRVFGGDDAGRRSDDMREFLFDIFHKNDFL